MNNFNIWQGRPNPLGATFTPEGVNFALFSENATGVDLCLFDDPSMPIERIRVPMIERTRHVWHCLIPDLKEGQIYGYRVHGPYSPKDGHRFNASKLLLDPYAKAITGPVNWSSETFGYVQDGGADADLNKDERDDAWCMPKSVVIRDSFEWEDDSYPDIPMADSIIYELHLKGFTKLCPHIPEELRGTYAALGSDFAIEYFKKLGITAVELMPLHHFINDQFLEDKGLTNYWGYNSIGFFAPHAAYSSSGGSTGGQVTEFKEMVKRLHAAGIEVILDVVYNHTGEGNHLGPTLSFRGVDNASYYRLFENDRRYYINYTGTGNTLNTQNPHVLQLLMDSLRYWIMEMHVDGFRFDLASTLARGFHNVDRLSGFFDCVHQDPVISRVKLIAEPWDLGEGGYQVGKFPVQWAEWNGKYRDCMRAYWKGDQGQLGEMAYRLTGSSDLFEDNGRKPYASVNFLTSHDGFTLFDSVAYNEKHNEANGENNMDGHNDNRSWNCGAEGLTEDKAVNTLRRRQLRNFMTTLFLSQGVPMLLAGDEFARTQNGNNNAYCQDNELSWLDWKCSDWQKQLMEFTIRLIATRKQHPIFRHPKYFQGRRIPSEGLKDLMWFDTDGSEMTQEDWTSSHNRCVAALISGDALDLRNSRGEAVRDDTFLMLLNAYHEPVKFVLPGKQDVNWETFLDTRFETGFPSESSSYSAGDEIELTDRSMCVFRLAKGSQDDARSVSWKHAQKGEAVPPPMPPKPTHHEPVDPSSAGPRFRARTSHSKKISDIAQGEPEPRNPPIK